MLTEAGIPCTVVLDSAVAYVMDQVDMVVVGSEAVVESGGLINAVGSNQMAIIAKSANVPFYALAESYKFHRLFPLSQYDLPTHNANILSFPRTAHRPSLGGTARPSATNVITRPPPPTPLAGSPLQSMRRVPRSIGGVLPQLTMTPEQIARNPEVDYTQPHHISLVFSDVGILTPEGVSQYLVGMFAG
jgi:translation initiation factor eIF-2B subunit alpha